MGYACPVCETPQRDGEHLAHHLAFTAMLHGGDHEAWLDDHAPDWAEDDPAALAERVTPHADAAEYHEVFADTVDRGRPDVSPDAHARHEHESGTRTAPDPADLDPEAASAVREARELTRRMHADEAESDDAGESTDGDAEQMDAAAEPTDATEPTDDDDESDESGASSDTGD